MNCREFDLTLDDFIDGELDATAVAVCEEHLAACPRCLEMLKEAQEMVAQAASLPREIQPSRDLWPLIAARITENKVLRGNFGSKWHTSWMIRSGLAAAAAILLFVSTAVLLRQGGQSNSGRTAVFPTQRIVQAAMPLDLATARETFSRARQDLRAILMARRADLDPKTMVVIEENLAVIDQAVGRIEQALLDDPGNGNLVTLLVATYDQEIVLLQQVSGLGPRV